jgi:hypothetical protein
VAREYRGLGERHTGEEEQAVPDNESARSRIRVAGEERVANRRVENGSAALVVKDAVADAEVACGEFPVVAAGERGVRAGRFPSSVERPALARLERVDG